MNFFRFTSNSFSSHIRWGIALLLVAGAPYSSGLRANPPHDFHPSQITLPVSPPADAIVLFDGKGINQFLSREGKAIDWPVENGALQSSRGKGRTNHLVSQVHFRDADIHVEFMLPEQGSGNSGIYIHGNYELQIFNSHGKKDPTMQDMGAVYGFSKPLVNACRPPGQWQVYDARYRAPRRNKDGEIVEQGSLTVWLNGKLVQDQAKFGEPRSSYHPFRYGATPYLKKVWQQQKQTMTGPLFLQDHDNPVQFRNVWIRPLDKLAFTYRLDSDGQTETRAIPELDPRGDVYKTEGPNDPLIYGSTTGRQKVIMLYVDFPDATMEIDTKVRAKKVLGEGAFEKLFLTQSYGKVTFDIRQVHGWRRLPKSHKEYSSKTTESHRELFAEIFKLYPKVNFLDYDYAMVNMPRIGNTAFGERDDIAIPYRGKKINVALNISSASPYVLAHETGHVMGLPDVYSYGDAKGPKNPAGPWDIMSSAGKASGFLGWHRHKLKWLDGDRKTYVTAGKHSFRLTPLNAPAGVLMIVVPTGNAKKPSKVFVIEVAQPARNEIYRAPGVLIYSIDASVASGQNPVVVYPKSDLANAPYQTGDTFTHKDAPMTVKVLKKNEDGRSFEIEVEVN